MSTKFPLAIQQQWLWNLLQKHHDWNSVVVYTFRLRGALNIEFLQKSLEEVIRRHGSLRARIVTVGGIPNQQIEEPSAFPLVRMPVSGNSKLEIDASAVRFVEEFCDQKMDLAVGPLLNVRLLMLADSEHWLVLAMHRFIADCYSIDQTVREFLGLYRELANGRPSPFPADPTQYADYALWQRKTDGDWLIRHEAYWKRRLAGATRIQLPVDECVSGVARGVLGKMNKLFGATLSTALRDLARTVRTLSATVMLAVYVAVLWRWCGQKDFVLPVMIAGRQSEHKSVVGYFSHMLYMRMELTGTETFTELLSYVTNEFFRALTHQDFGRMATQVPELLAGAFFQWITWNPDEAFGLAVSAASDLRELTVERVPIRDFGEGLTAIPPGMVDAEVTFFDMADGIYASGVYRADRFTASTMERLMGDLKSASEEFVRNPSACVDDGFRMKWASSLRTRIHEKWKI